MWNHTIFMCGYTRKYTEQPYPFDHEALMNERHEEYDSVPFPRLAI
jgi:hypothetical protein